ncbi:hypothetical protein A6746_19955 [Pseudomonas aeruginosa]|nr:hypothetical protein A6746_19955 [Pseudomonas aeruginosa]
MQGIETIAGFLAITLDEVHTEQFTTIIDGSVAIAVPDKEAIVLGYPSRPCLQAIPVEVEGNP